jgi:tRNA (cmo5U34)-methyltransferase
MSTTTTTPPPTSYRWNQPLAAAMYDQAAPAIHPCYDRVQREVLAALPGDVERPLRVLDLGGGSGRLAARLIVERPEAHVTIVDPSKAFLALAERRLRAVEPTATRWSLVPLRAQDEGWGPAAGAGRFEAVVSTSALHHLEPAEKRAAFRAIHASLRPGGVFINGDEHRPASDTEYRRQLEWWGEHMAASLVDGTIPAEFTPTFERWRERNLDRFFEPRTSGDDCHQTLDEQAAYLYGAGFRAVETRWQDRLWAVTVATR